MPSSASSSAQQARQALADQLREIRENAGLTGRALALAAGWRPQKVSRIEHAARPISATDLRTWCQACSVPESHAAELLAERHAAAGMWTTMRRLHRAGLRQAQLSVREWYEQVQLHRCYQSRVIPGLLQTAAYTRAGLESVRDRLHLTADDVDEALHERMDRQRVLKRPEARWVFVIEEQVLRYQVCDTDAHAEQLRHLLDMMSIPSVMIGIVPLEAPRQHRWPHEGFVVMDDRQVTVELVSGYLRVTTPSEVALYVAEFDALRALAVHGQRARSLIGAALDGLG